MTKSEKAQAVVLGAIIIAGLAWWFLAVLASVGAL